MNTIINLVHYEDWVQLFVNGEVHYQGHSIPDHVWIGLLKERGVTEGIHLNFDRWGPYFAYNDTPKNFDEAIRLEEELELKEKDGYRLDEWGEWVSDE